MNKASKMLILVLLVALLFYLVESLSWALLSTFDGDLPAGNPQHIASRVKNDTYGFYDVFFLPNEASKDALFSYLVDDFDHAKCLFYDLDDYFISQLVNRSQSREKVMTFDIVLHEENKKHIANLKNNTENEFKVFSGNLELSLKYITKSRGLMHNKFCVLDECTVITGSTNPTFNDLNRNDNNVFVVNSCLLAKNYLDEFYEIKTGQKQQQVLAPAINLCNNGSCFLIENYFCPDDECENHVISEISKANRSIIFYIFSFTSKNIANELISLRNKVSINGIVEKKQSTDMKEYLDDFISAEFDNNKYNMHNKVFVIDNETVITGSYNPTINGNTYNDENILLIHNRDIAGRYTEEFNKLQMNASIG